MNFDSYKKIDAINASAIKKGAKSMLKMRLAMAMQEFKDSPAMRWGRICHSAILEPASFVENVKVCDLSKNLNAYKAIIEAATNPDTVLSTAEIKKVEAMRAAFRANKDAMDAIKDMTFEFTLQWESDTYGAAKARVDGIRRDTILEYKTTKDAIERVFFSTAVKLGYDMAAGWYRHGAKVGVVVDNPAYVFIVQETDAPYEVAVYEAPQTFLEIGYAKAESIAKRYRECERTGIWTGIQHGGRAELVLPDWYVGGSELVMDIESNDMEGDE
jgi:hypothetical protein